MTSFNKNNLIRDGLRKETIDKLIEEIKTLELDDYFKANEKLTLKTVDKETIKNLVLQPVEIKYNDELSEFTYKCKPEDSSQEDQWEVIPVDYSVNFTDSNRWVSDRLPNYNEIYTGTSLGDITEEQESLYISIVVSAVFGGDIAEEFRDRCSEYDFINYLEVDNPNSWTSFVEDFVEIGSFKIKMLISAIRYKLQNEKNDIFSYTNVGLPEDVVSNLDRIKNQVKRIRMNYEEGELSSEKRKNKTKLEIKVLNAKMESEIDEVLKADDNYYQLWKLFKINSENVDATIKFKFKRAARKVYIEDLDNLVKDNKEVKNDPEFKNLYLNYCYKEMLRAYISKLRNDEAKKYMNCIATGEKYFAPKRV